MIAIKGINIPKRCEECKFCSRQETNDYGSFGECLLQKDKRVNCLVWSRDDDCPLVEIVTCKDCKYWNKKEEYCKQLSSTMGWEEDECYTVCIGEDFFCMDAERRDRRMNTTGEQAEEYRREGSRQKDMNDMKAWLVEDVNEEHGTIVFTKTRNKAKYLAVQYDEGLQDYGYDEVRAIRMSQLDKYAGDNPYVMDFDIDEDRLIMVRDAGFRCIEPEYEDCEKCVAKDYCEVYGLKDGACLNLNDLV